MRRTPSPSKTKSKGGLATTKAASIACKDAVPSQSQDFVRSKRKTCAWTTTTALLAFGTIAIGLRPLFCTQDVADEVPPVWPHPLQDSWVADTSGVFPKGCKWREVYRHDSKPNFWDTRTYEFLDVKRQVWTTKRPTACDVQGLQGWKNELSPVTSFHCGENHCIYENLWFSNGFFYQVNNASTLSSVNLDIGQQHQVTRNNPLNVLYFKQPNKFPHGKLVRSIPGNTLMLDYVFFLHPTAIGHWLELTSPLFSALRLEPTFPRPPDQILLLNLKRAHIMAWVREVLAITLGIPPHSGDLPPFIVQKEVHSVWKQITAQWEAYDQNEWIHLERVFVVKDTHIGGSRTFLSSEDGQLFRRMAYARVGLTPPVHKGPAAPKVITFQRKLANRRVLNEDELLAMLREFGTVQVVQFDATTPFAEQVEAMSRTDVYVAVHTSNLANTIFLPPGSAVMELIQRNWIWHNLDESFLVQTQALGDVHHYAFRCQKINETRYLNSADQLKFGGEEWSGSHCDTGECVEAHTDVDVLVDIGALRALLADRLPLVFSGASVNDAQLPWPRNY